MEFPLPKNHGINSGSNPDQPQICKSTGKMLLFVPVADSIRFPKIRNLKSLYKTNITFIWFESVCKFKFLSSNPCARRLLKMKLIGLDPASPCGELDYRSRKAGRPCIRWRLRGWPNVGCDGSLLQSSFRHVDVLQYRTTRSSRPKCPTAAHRPSGESPTGGGDLNRDVW